MGTAIGIAFRDGVEKQNEVIADNQEKQKNDTVSYKHVE